MAHSIKLKRIEEKKQLLMSNSKNKILVYHPHFNECEKLELYKFSILDAMLIRYGKAKSNKVNMVD